MCRLLGYVTDGAAPLAESLGEGLFDQFMSLCAIHGDGWGMAWHTPEGVEVATSHRSALDDPECDRLAHEPLSPSGMLHLRWATDGLAVMPQNTHPFTNGSIALAHNGNIAPIPALEELLDDEARSRLRGTTDSERYFQYVVQEISGADDEAAALQDAVSRLHARFPQCSLNALVLTATHLYAVHVNSAVVGPIDEVIAMYESADDIPLGHADSTDYFAMAYRDSDRGVHVISSGISPDGWSPVPADSILAIDLDTRRIDVLAVTPASARVG